MQECLDAKELKDLNFSSNRAGTDPQVFLIVGAGDFFFVGARAVIQVQAEQQLESYLTNLTGLESNRLITILYNVYVEHHHNVHPGQPLSAKKMWGCMKGNELHRQNYIWFGGGVRDAQEELRFEGGIQKIFVLFI